MVWTREAEHAVPVAIVCGSGFSNWAGWDALVAMGTLGLAVATFVLGWQARGQVRLQRRQLEASTRPFVFPSPTVEWLAGLPPAYPSLDWKRKVLPLTPVQDRRSMCADG
jgi:hypothetical protein